MIRNQESRIKELRDGFTVVELLVAMGVFTALLSFSVGVFIQGMRSQRELTDQIVVNNEMSLVLEQMAREMRTGAFFAPIGGSYDVGDFGGGALEFRDERGKTIQYQLFGSADAQYIDRNEDGVSARLTSKDVSVEELEFSVSRREMCLPWRVTVFLKVRPRNSLRDPVPIQTTISSRVLPVDLKPDENDDGENDFASCRTYLIEE